MSPSSADLHHAILSDIVADGRAPGVGDLVQRFGVAEVDLRAALRRLGEEHGIVLQPKDDEVWVAHPFSLAPTNFLVRQDQRSWWGNCAWCSLGIAALAGGAVTITTTLGAEERQVTIEVAGGRVTEDGLVVHFPIPMAQVWDNVIYSCSTMLVFDSEAQVEDWCRRHGIGKGDVRPLSVVARFAAQWYGRHLDADWRKWTIAEARALIADHGLSGPIWDWANTEGRF